MTNYSAHEKKSLPNWVKWIAQDKDGKWWGFSDEPHEHHAGWYENEVGRYIFIKQDIENEDWQKSLLKISV